MSNSDEINTKINLKSYHFVPWNGYVKYCEENRDTSEYQEPQIKRLERRLVGMFGYNMAIIGSAGVGAMYLLSKIL